jgi:hypothetical protein
VVSRRDRVMTHKPSLQPSAGKLQHVHGICRHLSCKQTPCLSRMVSQIWLRDWNPLKFTSYYCTRTIAPPCQPPLLTIIVTVVTINLFTIPRGSNRSIAGGKSMLSIFCARRWLLQYPKVDYVSQMGVVLPFPSDSRDSEKCTWAHIQRSASREEVGSRQSIASGSTNCPGTSKAPPCTGRTSSDRRAGLGAISTSVIQRMNYWQ